MRFALLAGEQHWNKFVVIGGLNPDFLAPNSPVPHLGTTDVDLLFELGFHYDRDEIDFSWLDGALKQGGFSAEPGTPAWRWIGLLGPAMVRLDLLCDVPDNPGQSIVLPGAKASVYNFYGPVAALSDPVIRELTVSDAVKAEIANAPTRVPLRFANLGGYVAAKAIALHSRSLAKDAYDLLFVLMYGRGGPKAAAHAAANVSVPPDRTRVQPYIREVVARYTGEDARAVETVVTELVRAGDDSDPEQLRADVIVAAQQFLDAFPSN